MAYHRTDNYWEPTYDGKTQYGYLSEFNWQNLFSNNGPLKQICIGKILIRQNIAQQLIHRMEKGKKSKKQYVQIVI